MEEEKEKSQTSNTSNPERGSLPSQVSKQPSAGVQSKKSSVEEDPRFDECVESEETPVNQAEKEFLEGKEYLMKQISKDGISLYDHLSQLINKVLSEKPKNAMETIEEDSQYLKEARFRYTAEGLRDVYTPPIGYERAKLLINLFKKEEPKEDEEVQPEVEVDEDQQPIKTDLMEHVFYCEKIGVAISRSEMICIAMSLDKLGASQSVSKYRFWGKIFGLFKNYYIAEVILTDEEYAKRKDEIITAAEEELKKEEEALAEEDKDGGGDADKEEAAQPQKKGNKNLGGKGDADTAIGEGEELTIEGGGEGEEEEEKQEVKEPPVIPEPPKSAYKKPPEVPAEYPGEGTNRNVFYVCNEPGDEWIELPDVTPQQIAVARQIRKYFTGFLDYNVITYPPFPGLEANYLRAQIARISAGTHVSPLGFYGFNVGGDEEEEEVDEEEDEEGGQKSYQEDPKFAGLALKDLMDSTMSFWVHHEPYILKQGRTTWWSPKEKKHGEEGDEEEEAEEEEEEDAIEPEVGPAILTPLSEDATIEGVPPWSTRSSSDLIPSLALGIVRSNLWPGAYAFAKGRKCDNVYIGWGHKRVAENYSPPGLPRIQLEYPLGPEIMEIDDPTPEQEEAWRIAHEEKKKPPEEEEGEEEEEEEEEADDD